ncbi:thioredoxin-disulfide reductase [Candidatus Pacearchaeota archaeon CG10_big_fil_rev_8_21_14_0_10_32_14]|nr:MAG: thioredoxin-disulfide reductase [Candidatus Pacearchaeota archaeon CG10_big_fil_rev_8_21_14_0_10_32_14]
MTEKKSTLIETPREKYDFVPDEKICYDVIIIGTGIVGWSAAMYTGRLGLKTLIIGEMPGGTITQTHVVENYPGFISLSGPELAQKVENHARDYDIDILLGKVEKIEKNKSNLFVVLTKKQKFNSKTIIYATGSKWKKLGVPGEKELENKGVSYCALCDGPLYKGKEVAMVGGSDSAVKESLLLSEYANKVYIIYRGEKVHPEPINLKRMEEKVEQGKIEVINNTNITEIKGSDGFVSSVVLDKPFEGKTELSLYGVFVAIGHIPLSDLAKEIGVKINAKGEIIIDRKAQTNVPGFYASGDVADTSFKQAITGVGEGVAAAYNAYEYVNKGNYVMPTNSEMNENKKITPLIRTKTKSKTAKKK